MHCQSNSSILIQPGGSIALVGHPNVGKSALFQRLTGQRVAISNYPGTTVEIARGVSRVLSDVSMIDTPGVIAFPPHSEDEEVTARVLLNEPLRAVLQVGDAKNLHRTLLLSVQLAEMKIPFVLALNMMDEARSRGVAISFMHLRQALGSPVVPVTAIHNEGIDELLSNLRETNSPSLHLEYAAEIENTLAEISAYLPSAPISRRALSLLWLSNDSVSEVWLRAHLDEPTLEKLIDLRSRLQASLSDWAPDLESISDAIQKNRLDFVEKIYNAAILKPGSAPNGLAARLGRLTTHPFWGLVILAVILYALFWFVGVFGAGTLVGLFEVDLLENIVNPWLIGWAQRLIPFRLVVDLLVGEYGLWTMGMTYALALILPIVTTFFLSFGVLEDSGYLPRLAALSNRLFQMLGLNGKAVLPMVLGLGCVTMATLTTRVMESKRDRLLVTLLLALAVPCSAQLGVVMGMLAGISLGAALIWGGVILVVLLAVGWLAARLVPGRRSPLLVELPPLRWPQFSNVLLKTLARLEWYIKEVVPLFLVGTFLMFILDRTGALSVITRAGEPLVAGWLGLPPEASAAFLMGFLRRDFGATGLFVMQAQGSLNALQVLVAMVTITLFIPCVASVLVIAKERGWRTAIGMVGLIIPLAFVVGGLLNRLLQAAGWGV
jgi:ferrous iron transport protein B